MVFVVVVVVVVVVPIVSRFNEREKIYEKLQNALFSQIQKRI